MSFRYFIINKPYGVLSQFTREVPEHKVLGDLYNFPSDVYPVGRLDKDSEGLLILTNDKKLTDRLLNPRNKHQRTYLAQVEGIPTKEAILQLNKGVTIKVDKKPYKTLPAKVRLRTDIEIEERNPPVRFRANIPTSWLELQLIEGKNRQVRRMCAKVGFPVLRLIRTEIVALRLSTLDDKICEEVNKAFLYKKLKL